MAPPRKALAEQLPPATANDAAPEHEETFPARGLHEKLVRVMHECAYVQKTGNANFGKFAGDEDIMRRVNPALVENGISCHVADIQILRTDKFEQRSGGVWERVMLRLVLRLTDAASGESIDLVGIGEGADPQDKAVYKAMTGARKYAWRLALNMATGDDPDVDHDEPEGDMVEQPQGDQSAPPRAAPRPAAAPQHRTTKAGNPSQAKFKFGQLAGELLSEGDDKDLTWYMSAIERSIKDPAKLQYKKFNQMHLDEVLAEQARRHEERQPQAGERRGYPEDPDDDIPFDDGAPFPEDADAGL